MIVMRRTTGASKRRRESKEWNESNHTHFKQLFKASSNTRATHTSHPMTKDIPTNISREHKRYQLNLLLDTIGGRTWTVRELMSECNKRKLVVLFEGANGVPSEDKDKYLANLLTQLLNEHKLVRVFETNGLGKSRWRYIPNTNIINRVLIEIYNDPIIQSVRNYCNRCVVSLKSMI
jgi:hypothetical protein